MKYLKILGLAAIAALALAAFAGASTASAAVLCKEAPNKAGECPTVLGHYAANTTFGAESTNTKLVVTGSSVVSEITCSSSSVTVENEKTEGSPSIPGKVTDVSWSGCKTSGGTACEVTTSSGYTGSITPTSDTGNGEIKVTGGTETTVTCGISFFQCNYKTTASGLTFTVTGGNPATFAAASQPVELAKSTFGCGNGADWSGTYTLKTVNGAANGALWIATKTA